MDMLVQYTPVSELSEDQKKRAKQSANQQDGFTIIDGKVVSLSELKGKAPQTAQKQNLFE